MFDNASPCMFFTVHDDRSLERVRHHESFRRFCDGYLSPQVHVYEHQGGDGTFRVVKR